MTTPVLNDWYFSGRMSPPSALGTKLGFGLGPLLGCRFDVNLGAVFVLIKLFFSGLDLLLLNSLDSELGFGLGSALGT